MADLLMAVNAISFFMYTFPYYRISTFPAVSCDPYGSIDF
jgi:hypothetical protein